jgi:hypothetical protein
LEDLHVKNNSNAGGGEDVPAINDEELFRLWGKKKSTRRIASLTGLSLAVVIKRLTPILIREVESRIKSHETGGRS